MTALLRKEAEALGPYALAFSVLVGVNLFRVLWSADLLHEPFGMQRGDGSLQSATMWAMGFLVGHGVVAHELRDGYVEFLDGLPTTRWRVFAAKVVASGALMTLLAACSLGMDLGHAWLAPPPAALDPVPATVLTNALMWGAGLAGLGTGMLLSWLGPVAWGVLGLSAMVALWFGLLVPPARAWFPVIGSMGTLEWHGAHATHALAPPLLHLALAGLSVVVSAGLFAGPGRFLTAAGAGGLTVARVGLTGCGVLLGAPLVALFSLLLLFQVPELWTGKRSMPSAGGHFRVLYTPGEEARAREVADEVDELSAQVGTWLGATEPLSLDIELLGAPTHHLGVFTGGKIRLARTADRGVLAHELTHAHAFSLAGRAAWDHRANTHFFEEGVADWVRARVMGHRSVPPVAGAVQATGQARFDELVDSTLHQSRHDITQSYLLGQVFAVALVDVEGDAAPGCVLKALGDLDAGSDVSGLALWYALAAVCELDLDAVQDRWSARLEAAAAELPGPLPELRARVLPEDRALAVTDARGRGWPLHCGFRSDSSDSPQHWVYLEVNPEGRCEIPLGALSGDTFEYQVGYAVPDEPDRPVVYLPWTRAHRP